MVVRETFRSSCLASQEGLANIVLDPPRPRAASLPGFPIPPFFNHLHAIRFLPADTSVNRSSLRSNIRGCRGAGHRIYISPSGAADLTAPLSAVNALPRFNFPAALPTIGFASSVEVSMTRVDADRGAVARRPFFFERGRGLLHWIRVWSRFTSGGNARAISERARQSFFPDLLNFY